ncbi:MAG: hypothetical protein QM500_10470 [Methylococcales bacterium]
MILEKALHALLEHIESSDKPIVVNWDIVQQWNEGVLEKLEKHGLLVSASSAQILECRGCENRCFMDVVTNMYNEKIRAFIVCDDVDMQSQIGRIEIPLERLKQWKSGVNNIAGFIHGLLVMQNDIDNVNESEIRLGMLKGKGGRRWVSLLKNPLVMVISGYKIPINDLLFVDNGELVIDRLRIDELLNLSPVETTKAYVPDVSKREAQKTATQLMYQGWQDAYDELKVEHPNQNIGWICRKIAKMSVGQNKDSGYIRRKIKS